MSSEKLKGNLDMLLLAVLAPGAAHGYAVISRLAERSAGAFDLPEGTVYPALHRLESAGLLASTWEVVGGRRRRLYRLTATGQEALAEPGQAVAVLQQLHLARARPARRCQIRGTR